MLARATGNFQHLLPIVKDSFKYICDSLLVVYTGLREGFIHTLYQSVDVILTRANVTQILHSLRSERKFITLAGE